MRLHLAEGLTLPLEAATQTFLVVGKRGSGKSTTCVRLAEQLIKAAVPIVAIDPVDRWYGLKAARDGKGPGLSVYVFGGEHADLPLEPGAGAMIADTLVEHRISAVLSVKHLSGRERGRFVADLAGRLFQRNREPLHVFLEEAHEVAPQQPFKGDEEMLGRVTRLWKLGRSSGLGGSAITQRPASLSKNITTQAEILIVHRTLGPQDVAAVREWIRYHGERDDILGELATLKTGEAFIWAPDFPEATPIGLRRVQILDRETFDSTSTPKVGARAIEPKALASVDLEQLKTKMAATIEKAKAEDPRELRRRIGELEREIRNKPVVSNPAPKEEKRIEVPVLKDAQVKRLEVTLHAAEKLSERTRVALIAMAARAAEILQALRAPRTAPDPAAPPAPTPRRAAGVGEAAVGQGGLRRILTALAQRPQGLTLRQIGVRAGLSSRSGTFSTYLSRARGAGWIVDAGDHLTRITGVGVEALGEYELLPTGAALLDYWLRQLGASGAARMLRVLADVYPEGLTLEHLGEKAGISNRSGTFSTYLSRLRSLELIEGRGRVCASKELFS